MKTIFVINTKAGKGEGEKIKQKIKNIKNAEIYETKSVGDGERFAREYCKENGAARFIACGGDGTFGEVLNGTLECEGCEVGLIPVGTGNDFCRNFKGYNFFDIEKQLNGKTEKCDIIKYSGIVNGKEKTGYCANMINIGFDCNVADKTAEIKKKPFISGSLAYFVSIFIMLIKKRGANLKIEIDGEVKHTGKLLLTSVANGIFCGGGVKSNPMASLCDGLLDINIVNNMTRLRFLGKLPFYMKGTHIKLKNIEKLIYNCKGRKMIITPLDEKMRICIDGEIFDAGKIEIEAVNKAFNFVLPEGEKI